MNIDRRAWIGDAILALHARRFCCQYLYPNRLNSELVSNQNLARYCAESLNRPDMDGTRFEAMLFDLHEINPNDAKDAVEKLCEWTVERLSRIKHRAISGLASL